MTQKPLLTQLAFWQTIVIALLIMVSYLPIEPIETKIRTIIVLVGALLLFFLRHLRDAIEYSRFLRLTLMIGFSIAYIAVSGMFFPTLNDYSANKFLYTYYTLAIFGLVMPWALYREGGAAAAVAALLLISVGFGLVSFFPNAESDNLRYSAIGLSPTMMAKLTLICSLLFVVYHSQQKKIYVATIALFIFGIFATLNTGSRGSLIALAVAYGVYAVLRGGAKNLGRFALASIVLVGLVYIGLQFAPEDIQSRFTLEAVSIEEQSDEGDRLFLWQVAVEGIRQSFWGRGLGSFSLATFIGAPHNIVLESVYELGFVFSAVFLLYIFYPLVRLKSLLAQGDWRVDFVSLTYLYILLLALFGGELSLSNALLYLTASMIWLAKPRKAPAARPGPVQAQVRAATVGALGLPGAGPARLGLAPAGPDRK